MNGAAPSDTTFDLSTPGGACLLAMGNHASLEVFVETLLNARDDLRILVVVDAGHARSLRWPGHPRVVERTVDPADQAALLSMVDLHGVRLGCVMAWPRRLSDAFIAHFAGALFNLHYGDLPRYRGAGGQSWPVLNAETEITAHIQQMHSAMDT
ncbi:formyltransferase family protein, partial [Thermomonas sp.]